MFLVVVALQVPAVGSYAVTVTNARAVRVRHHTTYAVIPPQMRSHDKLVGPARRQPDQAVQNCLPPPRTAGSRYRFALQFHITVMEWRPPVSP